MIDSENIICDESLKFKYKVIIGCMLFSGFAFFLPDSVNSIALYIAIPVAFLISLFGDGRRFNNHSFKTSLFLFAWLLISTLWADYPDLAMVQNKQSLGVVLVSYIVGKNAYNKKMRPWMYGIWVAIFLSAVYYANTHIIPNIEVGQVRLNDEKLNANMMGYYTFYLTFAIFILGEEIQKPIFKRLFRLLFLGMIFVSYYVAIITASRQVLIIQIPFLICLLYVRYIKEVSYTYRFVFFILVAVVIFFSRDIVVDSYNNSLLQKRNQQEVKDDTRALLVKDAFRVGMEHFYTGVGNGNYVKYSVTQNFSHNSYLELFANTGIIGLSIYLYMLIYFLKTQYWRYKVTEDKFFLFFIIFFLIYCLYNFFYVFYPYQWLFAFFILLSSHSDSYFEETYYILDEDEDYSITPS